MQLVRPLFNFFYKDTRNNDSLKNKKFDLLYYFNK